MEKRLPLIADVLWACRSHYGHDSEFFINPHSHEFFYHVFYMSSGERNVVVSGKSYRLSPGMVMLVPPGEIHEMQKAPPSSTDTSVRFEEVKFVVYDHYLKERLNKLDRVFSADACAATLINSIVDLAQKHLGQPSLSLFQYFLGAFLYQICAENYFNCSTMDSPVFLKSVDCSDFSNATLETVKYFESHYMGKIVLDDVSEAIGYNKTYISTAVKKDLNMTPSDVLMQIRIRMAADLLAYSDCSIRQIYEQTGFKNVNHFTRIFKRVVGIPPVHYRKSFLDFGDLSPRLPENTPPLNIPILADHTLHPDSLKAPALSEED